MMEWFSFCRTVGSGGACLSAAVVRSAIGSVDAIVRVILELAVDDWGTDRGLQSSFTNVNSTSCARFLSNSILSIEKMRLVRCAQLKTSRCSQTARMVFVDNLLRMSSQRVSKHFLVIGNMS